MFITTDARAGVREQCLALGADAFLRKSFTYDELMSVTRLLLAKTESSGL